MFIASNRARKAKARRAVAVLSVVASVVPHPLVVPRDGPVELLPGQAGGLGHVLDAEPFGMLVEHAAHLPCPLLLFDEGAVFVFFLELSHVLSGAGGEATLAVELR